MSRRRNGQLKDRSWKTLQKKVKESAAYLDNESEAEKVFVEEFAQKLYAVANNVFVNVKFDPKVVKDYRLIGFDNKKTAIADKLTELSGGVVGSGQSFLAAFEITPVQVNASVGPAATVQLSYNLPTGNETIKEEFETLQNFQPFEKSDINLRFASTVIMFGTLLKQSEFAKDFTWDELSGLAISSTTPGNLLQHELVELIGKAKKFTQIR